MRLTVNGEVRDLNPEPGDTLATVLRERLGLTGTKVACGRGECGACTVLVARGDEPSRAIYSCLALALSYDGASVTTIEGLGRDGLHPLQDAFISHDALQCGFCTPGQILAAAALLSHNPDPDDAEIRAALAGNLCRCGAYPGIMAAVRSAARQMADG